MFRKRKEKLRFREGTFYTVNVTKRRSPPPRRSVNFLPLILSLITMGGIAMLLQQQHSAKTFGSMRVTEIGIEHKSALRLGMSFTTGSGTGLFEISHDGTETALVSLPDTWQVRAVRFARLQDVPSDPTTFGFKRWHLPPGVVLSLFVPSPVGKIQFSNASLSPVELRIKRIDLQANTATSDVYLVKDQPLLLP